MNMFPHTASVHPNGDAQDTSEQMPKSSIDCMCLYEAHKMHCRKLKNLAGSKREFQRLLTIELRCIARSCAHYDVRSFEACYHYEKAMSMWLDVITIKKKSNMATRYKTLGRKYGNLIAAEMQSRVTPLERKAAMRKVQRTIIIGSNSNSNSNSNKLEQPLEHFQKLDRYLEQYFKKHTIGSNQARLDAFLT
jgi:hypothetical protein